ncbi:MAG: hypothetical protein U5N56_06625 [Candidatus Marinimicrobia bacterium]|nr:hypothetical protein [Candidatus Neomarinimicrobiota bacterium]
MENREISSDRVIVIGEGINFSFFKKKTVYHEPCKSTPEARYQRVKALLGLSGRFDDGNTVIERKHPSFEFGI